MKTLAGKAQRRLVLEAAFIFTFALGVRLLHVYSIRTMPFFQTPVSDGRSYWEWAGRIAGGDWVGRDVFYQAPLYPYFLAIVRLVGRSGPPSVYLVQAVLGSLGCVALFLGGRLFFGRRAGVVAGVLLATYPPTVFFDGVIQKASLSLSLTTLWLLSIGLLLRRPRPSRWTANGLMTGALWLARESALTAVPIVLLWLWTYFRRRTLRRRCLWSLCYAAGVTAVLLPVALRNLCGGGAFALTTSQMGPNFYIGNNPRATGVYRALIHARGNPAFERDDAAVLAERALRRELTPTEVSRYWMAESWKFIRSDPVHWARLMAKKGALVWNVLEAPDTEDYYFYRKWSFWLRWIGPFWDFGTLLPLAGAGVYLTWTRRRKLWILYLAALAFGCSVALFYVLARYRLPLVPILMLFAAAAIERAPRLWRRGDTRRLATAAGIAGILAVFAHLPLHREQTNAAMSYYNWGRLLHVGGRHDEAMEKYRTAIELRPNLATAHFNLGNILLTRGRTREALAHFRAAVRGAPEFHEAWNNLGTALAREGRVGDAAEAFRKAVRVNPWNRNARDNLRRAAATLRQNGHIDRADRIDRFLREVPAGEESP